MWHRPCHFLFDLIDPWPELAGLVSVWFVLALVLLLLLYLGRSVAAFVAIGGVLCFVLSVVYVGVLLAVAPEAGGVLLLGAPFSHSVGQIFPVIAELVDLAEHADAAALPEGDRVLRILGFLGPPVNLWLGSLCATVVVVSLLILVDGPVLLALAWLGGLAEFAEATVSVPLIRVPQLGGPLGGWCVLEVIFLPFGLAGRPLLGGLPIGLSSAVDLVSVVLCPALLLPLLRCRCRCMDCVICPLVLSDFQFSVL